MELIRDYHQIREVGFEFLDKKVAYSDARRDNNTHRFVQSFNPEIINTDELNIYCRILPEGFNQGKQKHIERVQRVMQMSLTELKEEK